MPGSLVVTAQGVSYRVDPMTPEGVVGKNQMEKFSNMGEPIRKWGAAVARIRFMSGGRQKLCTGFLVSPELLLTNEHCLSTPGEFRSALFEFGLDSPSSQVWRYQGDRIVTSNAALDYSLIRLRGRPGDRFGYLTLARALPAPGARLVTIHHPRGQLKHVSRIDCSVSRVPVSGNGKALTDLLHICDTQPGSSGAPLIDPVLKQVVALHHLGCEEPNCDARRDLVNQGVLFEHIAVHLIDTGHARLVGELAAQ